MTNAHLLHVYFLELGLDPKGLCLSFSWLGTSPWSFSKVFVDMPTLDVSELNIVLAALGKFSFGNDHDVETQCLLRRLCHSLWYHIGQDQAVMVSGHCP